MNMTEVRPKGSIDDTVFQFYSYYYVRDRFLHQTKVIKEITEAGPQRVNTPQAYTLANGNRNYYLSIDEVNTAEMLYPFFVEDDKTSMTKFSKHYKDCVEGLEQFITKTGRVNEMNNLNVKAFYREIYLDKKRYGRRRCQHIFNDYLKNKEAISADYYLLDEKLNLGRFRELGLLDEYFVKNILLENLYCLVCKVLAKLKPEDIVKTFVDIMDQITEKVFEIDPDSSWIGSI